jgi:DNA polymerase III delta prime subunit
MSNNSLNSNAVPHAILLAGGTLDDALKVAAAANCLGDGGFVCEKCLSCVKMRENNHPDVTVFNCVGAKVEQVRELCADTLILPNEGRYKIYILHEVHELSHVCQNALLKPLEEPPARVVFILTAARADNLLPTVRSRLFRRNLGAERILTAGEASGKILDAYDERNELNLLLSVLACDKMTRDDLSDLIGELRQGLLKRRAVTKVEKLGEIQLSLERNIGVGHVCGAIAATLSR